MEGGDVRAAHPAIYSLAQMQGGDVPRDRRIESEQKDGLVAEPMMGSVGTRCVNNGWNHGRQRGIVSTDSSSKQTIVRISKSIAVGKRKRSPLIPSFAPRPFV